MIDLSHSPLYPRLPDNVMRSLLAPPATNRQTPLRVVVDSDLDNEVDDFFAVIRLLLAHVQGQVKVEALYAAPWSFRDRLLQMLLAQRLEKIPEERSEPQQALINKYSSQIRAIESLGLNPKDFLFPPEGSPGNYDHVSIGPGVGMERSYTQLQAVAKLMKYDGPILKGADSYLQNGCPVQSPAVHHLISLARSACTENPIYVMGLACATNLASALLLAPDIRDKVVMTWTAGYPTNVTTLENTSFNLEQDVPAAQILFTCGAPLVYLPGFYIGQQLTLSKPDMEEWIRPSGAPGAALYHRYMNNPLFPWYGIDPENLTGRIWNIWDLINIGWLLDPPSVSSQLVKAPKLSDDLYWIPNPDGALMLESTYTNYNAIMPPFVKLLQEAPNSTC